jgi:quinol monooxygenase YgiN
MEESSMIIVTATITAKHGKRDEIISQSQDVIESTRLESGCISYELFASTEDENVLVMFERWENIEALELHKQTDHYKAFGPSIKDLLEKKIELGVYSVR